VYDFCQNCAKIWIFGVKSTFSYNHNYFDWDKQHQESDLEAEFEDMIGKYGNVHVSLVY
jgi:hypothetical protein